jgi:hypothetical protein
MAVAEAAGVAVDVVVGVDVGRSGTSDRVAVTISGPQSARIVTAVGVVTAVVLMVKVALVALTGTITVIGTLARGEVVAMLESST